MIRTALTALFLFGLWLSISGIYKPLVIGFGAVSALIAVLVVRRMDDAADADRLQIDLKPFNLITYLGWLLVEIAKSNWAVTKVILSPDMKMQQNFFTTPFTQKTELGQTIFANSITLTPGTISVEVEDGHFWVHALDYSDDDPEALNDMCVRVSAVESV